MGEQKNLTGYPSIDRPWLKYYSEEAINGPLPEGTIYDYLWKNNKEFPDEIAMEYLGRCISYQELFQNIEDTAKAFLAIGVKEGDIVTVALPSIPEAIYVVYALNRLGAVANMIHPLPGEKELVFYLNEVESKFAVLFDATYGMLKKATWQTKLERVIIVSVSESMPETLKSTYELQHPSASLSADAGLMSWNAFLRIGSNMRLPITHKDPNSVAIISHTGGTTGEPKGVMCSDRSTNTLIWLLGTNLETHRKERCLVVLPPFVNYSLVDSMLGMITLGIVSILLPQYEPEKFSEYVLAYQPNHLSSIPAYWEALLKISECPPSDWSCLQHIYYGGEAMSVETELAVNRVLKAHGVKNTLHKGLGATELVSASTMTYDDCNTPGCVGAPLSKINCKIVEPGTTNELTYNQEGEICFAGPTVMIGYYNKLAETNEIIKIHSDGQRWLHTGDLGYIDENGVIFVTGRIKRIIMTKGKDQQVTKMFPDRIEKVLNSHSAVQLSCVIGVPDEKRINYAKAVIELNAGHTASEELKSEIREFCRGKLPEYQIPDAIEFIAALPRTDRGKVDYRALE